LARRFLTALAVIGFLAAPMPALAQIPTHRGSNSILLRFDPIPYLTGAKQGVVGVRHFVADRTALVPEVQFRISGESSEIGRVSPDYGLTLALERHFGPGNASPTQEAPSHDSNTLVGVVASGHVVPYLGLGMAWTYSGHELSRHYNPEGPVSEDHRFEYTEHTLEVFGSAGFQVAVGGRFQVGAEFHLGEARYWNDTSRTWTRQNSASSESVTWTEHQSESSWHPLTGRFLLSLGVAL